MAANGFSDRCGTIRFTGGLNREGDVANREQRGSKEKKKPKQDKGKKDKSAPPPFVPPELVRRPHKGKEQS